MFYFDFRVGERTYRDRAGAEYPDPVAALEGLRSVVVELAKSDGVESAEYEVTLRQDLKPLHRVRLSVSEEELVGRDTLE